MVWCEVGIIGSFKHGIIDEWRLNIQAKMIIHQVVVVNQLIMDRMMIRVWDGNVSWLWWWEESEVGHGVVAREGGGRTN